MNEAVMCDDHVHDCPHLVKQIANLETQRDELEVKVERLQTGWARARHLKRQQCLAARANIMCACGQLLQVTQELDAHLDHMIEADAALQAGFGLRDHAERAEQRIKELEADQGMLKSVHGALVDAGCRMGDIGKCEADLVREVTRQRDEAKERVKELEAEVLLAFVAGAAWWQAEGHGATMFSDERRRAEAEAERRWPGVGWPTHPQRVREAEQRLANLVEAGKSLLSYVKQIELTLYSENDSGMHPVVERFSAALAAAQPEEAAERG